MNTKLHPDTLPFLQELTVNNNRPWFNDHKERWLAIKADFDAKGIAGYDTFIAGAKVAWASATDKLKLIYMQKWAALCYMDNMEAWSEIRRTDVPALSPLAAADIFACRHCRENIPVGIPVRHIVKEGGSPVRRSTGQFDGIFEIIA